MRLSNNQPVGSFPSRNRSSSMLAFFAALTMIMCLSGCIVGPDFRGVGADRIPVDYTESSLNASQHRSVSVEQWWQHFADPQLNQLVEQAMSRNLNLQEMLERVVEARANYQLQTGSLAPDGDFLGSYEYTSRSENSSPFVGITGDPFNLISLGFGTSWEIDLFGRIRRTIESADATVQLQALDAENLRRILIGDIASSYVRVRLFQQQIQIARQSVDVQRGTLVLISERKDSGVSTELDSVQTRAFLHRSEALLALLQQQLELELNNLSALLGEAPHNALVQQIGHQSLPNIPVVPDTGIPADLVRRRPDVQRDERAVAAASALIGVAEADLYPQLTLVGNIGLASTGISSLFTTESLLFNVGPSVQWNILNFGRIEANIQIQESLTRQAYFRYQQTALNAVREVEDTLTQHRTFREQWERLQAAVRQDQKAVELAMERYQVGRINFQRVLDTQQQLLQDQQQLVLAQANAIDQVVRMFQALGGGWQANHGVGGTGCDSCGQCSTCNSVTDSQPVFVQNQHGFGQPVLGQQVIVSEPAIGQPFIGDPGSIDQQPQSIFDEPSVLPDSPAPPKPADAQPFLFDNTGAGSIPAPARPSFSVQQASGTSTQSLNSGSNVGTLIQSMAGQWEHP